MNGRSIGALALVAGFTLLATPAPAQAHPLGNFTSNQYAGLRVTSSGVDVDFVLDLAELPAYQAKHDEIDTDHDGRDGPAELAAYATATCRSAAAASAVSIDGRNAAVRSRATAITFPPGAGGLTTLRLQCALHADGHVRSGTAISFQESYLADRIGWREITAVGDRYTLTSSDVPTQSVSTRLTNYPKGVPTEDVRSATLTVRPGGPAAAAFVGEQNLTVQARGVDRLTNWFTDLVGHPQLTWGVGTLAVLMALILGGAHAAAPGHGKTIMAAYLVGGRGRTRHALTVAASVAVTHTIGVLVLGLILATSLQLAPQNLYEWLRLASGVLVALVGVQLLRRAQAFRRAQAAALTREPSVEHSLDSGHSHAAEHSQAEYSLAGGHSHTAEHSHAGHSHAAEHSHAGHSQAEHSHAEHSHAEHSHAEHSHAEHSHAEHSDATEQPRAEHSHGTEHGHSHDVSTNDLGGLRHAHGGSTHTHVLPPVDAPFRVRTLLAMGFAGGLSPSPSAVVVLLGAAALGRAWYGVLLVVAYGIGLAAVLTGIGLALARWGERLHRIGSGRFAALLTHRLPIVTATAILAVGVGMAALSIESLYVAGSLYL